MVQDINNLLDNIQKGLKEDMKKILTEKVVKVNPPTYITVTQVSL